MPPQDSWFQGAGKEAPVMLDWPCVLTVCAGWSAPQTRWWSQWTQMHFPSGSGTSPLTCWATWLKSPRCSLAWATTPTPTRPTTQNQIPWHLHSTTHRWGHWKWSEEEPDSTERYWKSCSPEFTAECNRCFSNNHNSTQMLFWIALLNQHKGLINMKSRFLFWFSHWNWATLMLTVTPP